MSLSGPSFPTLLFYLRNVIKIANMNLLFEFEDCRAETFAKLLCKEIQKKINTAIQKDWLTSSAFLSFLHHNQFAANKKLNY